VSGKPIRIATRASRLALWQAHHVAQLLKDSGTERPVEIVHISTAGDRDRSEPLSKLGGQGVFTREVQRALLDGRADVAVHSLKDLPTEHEPGLTLASVPKRSSPFDALVWPASAQIDAIEDQHQAIDLLPNGARIGTGSPRRAAQLLNHRSDFEICEVRGNVETRLAKLDEGQYDALVLACAGLSRLGLEERVGVVLSPPLMYPAAGQGALGIECRADDQETVALLAAIDDRSAQCAARAERRVLSALRAGCHAPLGTSTSIDGSELTLEAVVLSQDGRERLTARSTGACDDPESIGDNVAAELRSQGADRLVEQAR